MTRRSTRSLDRARAHQRSFVTLRPLDKVARSWERSRCRYVDRYEFVRLLGIARPDRPGSKPPMRPTLQPPSNASRAVGLSSACCVALSTAQFAPPVWPRCLPQPHCDVVSRIRSLQCPCCSERRKSAVDGRCSLRARRRRRRAGRLVASGQPNARAHVAAHLWVRTWLPRPPRERLSGCAGRRCPWFRTPPTSTSAARERSGGRRRA